MIIIIGRSLIFISKSLPLLACFFWHTLHSQFSFFNVVYANFLYVHYMQILHYFVLWPHFHPQTTTYALKFKQREMIVLSMSFPVCGYKDFRENTLWFPYIMQNCRDIPCILQEWAFAYNTLLIQTKSYFSSAAG